MDPTDTSLGFAPVIEGGLPTDAAKLYTGPIVITQADTRINAVAIDAAGNTSDTVRGTFSPQAGPALPLPVAPTLTGTAGQQQVSLKWNALSGRGEGHGLPGHRLQRGRQQGALPPCSRPRRSTRSRP